MKQWTRMGDLGETPERITDELPLSDQENQGKWFKCEIVSDEFDGTELNDDYHVYVLE